jgi:hypothetical protein
MDKELAYFAKRAIRPKLIDTSVDPVTSGVITIPACGEPDIIRTLESLADCDAPRGVFEIIILINHGVDSSSKVKEMNDHSAIQVADWIENHTFQNLRFFVLSAFELTKKESGVGNARKILMDEAARRLVAMNNLQAPIIGLDADCIVSKDYLVEIESYFKKNEDIQACSIQFEHNLDGLDTLQKKAITQYEKHLRYYIDAQRMAGFPFAFQTIGSSMAVRCIDYIKQGGMNRRKAGEDFYFLQKFIELGQYGELHSTTVFPSGRVSDRVPFGTGKAVADALLNDGEVLTYHFQSFLDIKSLFEKIPFLFNAQKHEIELMQSGFPESVNQFLQTVDFHDEVSRVQKNTSSENAFRKRFFRWFNAFMLMKYLHFARDHFYPNQSVQDMVSMLRKWK